MAKTISGSFIPGSEKPTTLSVGLYFGSFNPIHMGHLIIAQHALDQAKFDYVWFIISPQNPFKQKKNLLPEYERLKMVELAIEGNNKMMASNVEFRLPKPSYTIDTLTHLADTYKTYSFSLIMGQDNLTHFHKWKNHESILKHYSIWVYPRPGYVAGEIDAHKNIHIFKAPLLDISATYIRQRLKENTSVRYLVPDAVHNYLEAENLYS
ncbi:MAG: nicotinate (nicotinamide) nucleotide adenylyltransferase [Bacteroidota bacterium]